ncbi:MAG: CPBP family intramembrane metalloprotease [Ignavibacteria bacterium]|nr:CPBP family intramembrane metalloprotease [Ignavibacteria bacterium]
MKTVFVNRHGEIRSGWRIGIFVVVAVALMYLFASPLRFLRPGLAETSLSWLGMLLGTVVALAGALLASYLLTRFVNRKPLGAIGLWFHAATFREFTAGCILGFLGMTIIFLALLLMNGVEVTFTVIEPAGIAAVILVSLFHFASAAMLEEVIFRGYPFQTLIQGVTVLPAVLIMAVLFSAAHFFNPNASVFGMINIALAAILLSVAYLKTRSLWLPFGLHLGWNFSQTTLYGLPTSGISFDQYQFLVASVSAPEWLSGGAFGPEGGLLATVSLTICTVYLLKSPQFTIPVGIITLDSIEDLIMTETTNEGERP